MPSIFDDMMKKAQGMVQPNEMFQQENVIDDPEMMRMEQFEEQEGMEMEGEDPNPMYGGSTYGVPEEEGYEEDEGSEDEQIRDMLVAQIQNRNSLSDEYQQKAQQRNLEDEQKARKLRDGGY